MTTTPPNAFAELERLRRRVRARALRQGFLGWAAVAAPAVTAAVWLAGGEHMGGGFIATGLCASLVAGLAVAGWRLLWRPWRRYAGAAAFARAVEACGDFGNVVVASEEAVRRPERWATGDAVGRELVRRVLVHCAQVCPGLAVRISAQERLSRFYADFAFAVVGEPYMEDGIAHIEMLRRP